DELVALSLQDTARLRRLTQPQGRVILALDGLQPDVGQEVLWVLRDCLSGEVLLARSLLSATHDDIAALLREVKQALEVQHLRSLRQNSCLGQQACSRCCSPRLRAFSPQILG